jgi:arylsulfatase A-like enzyme
MRLVSAATVVVTGAALAVAPGGATTNDSAEAAAEVASQNPNVVVFVIDDQAEGTLDAMPIVRKRLLERGVSVANGIIPTSWCCPSRATLLTGQYARTTGVYHNVGAHGGWPTFHSSGSGRTLSPCHSTVPATTRRC